MFQCNNEVISIMGQIGSEKYFDDTFEYKHVVLPPEVNTYGEEEDGGSVKISKVIVNRFSKLSFRDALLEQVGLMVLEEIHPLGADCGSILEDLISGVDSVSAEETMDDKGNVNYVYEIDGPSAHSLHLKIVRHIIFPYLDLVGSIHKGSVTCVHCRWADLRDEGIYGGDFHGTFAFSGGGFMSSQATQTVVLISTGGLQSSDDKLNFHIGVDVNNVKLVGMVLNKAEK
ncbi:replication protein A 32 kDa subunit B, partial [Tanacetum coccineum]